MRGAIVGGNFRKYGLPFRTTLKLTELVLQTFNLCSEPFDLLLRFPTPPVFKLIYKLRSLPKVF